MIFEISKTSDWYGKQKPCKKAKMVNNDGENKKWQININTLKELLKLREEVGKLIINSDSIEIYDSYRE